MRTVEAKCGGCGCPLIEVVVDDAGATTVRWRVRNEPVVTAALELGRTRMPADRRTDWQFEPIERPLDHPEVRTMAPWCDRHGAIRVPFAELRARHAQALKDGTTVRWRISTARRR